MSFACLYILKFIPHSLPPSPPIFSPALIFIVILILIFILILILMHSSHNMLTYSAFQLNQPINRHISCNPSINSFIINGSLSMRSLSFVPLFIHPPYLSIHPSQSLSTPLYSLISLNILFLSPLSSTKHVSSPSQYFS